MARRVGILSLMRPRGEPLQQTLMQHIQGRPACEWAMRSAREAARRARVAYCVGVRPEARPILDVARSLGVDTIPCTQAARTGRTNEAEGIALAESWDIDWVLEINLCFPFLTPEGHSSWIGLARNATRPACGVLAHRGIVWDANGEQVTICPDPGTGGGPVYYVQGRCYRASPLSLFGSPDPMPDAELIPLPDGLEYRLSIGTEHDLALARHVARGCLPLPGVSRLADLLP